MEYEKIKQKDLGKEVRFKFSKRAFKSNKLHCDCNTKLNKIEVEMEIPDSPLIMRLEVFKCPKCGMEYMNGEQARKMDI